MTQTDSKGAAPKVAAQVKKVANAGAAPFATADVAALVRETAEKSVRQARENYDRLKAAAEDNAKALEQSFASASDGATAVNRKLVDLLQASADAQFGLLRDLIGAKSVAEAFELHGAFVRKQIVDLSAQSRQIAELAKETVTRSTKPLGDNVLKTFKELAPGR